MNIMQKSRIAAVLVLGLSISNLYADFLQDMGNALGMGGTQVGVKMVSMPAEKFDAMMIACKQKDEQMVELKRQNESRFNQLFDRTKNQIKELQDTLEKVKKDARTEIEELKQKIAQTISKK